MCVCVCRACTERLALPVSVPWFAILFRVPVSESVKQLLSCQRLCGYVVLRRIKFTAGRTPLILTFQTFSSSGFYWKEIEWANFTSFCVIIMLHTFCWLFSFLCLLAQTTSKRCTNIPSHSVLVNTQHKDVYMQRHSDLINSIFLPPSPFSLSTHAHTHMHMRFFQSACANMREAHKRERGRLN